MRFNYYLLGEILEERRMSLGLSKNKLSQLIGISSTELTRIERGIRQIPNIITLIYMCEVLDLNFINILKITGFVDRKNLVKNEKIDNRKYQFNTKQNNELELNIYAESEEQAMKFIEELLENLELSSKKVDKIISNFNEENTKIFKSKSAKNLCDSCEYYCSNCKKCTL